VNCILFTLTLYSSEIRNQESILIFFLIYFNLFVLKIYFQGLNSSEKLKESLKKIIVFPVVSPHFSCYTVYKNHRILTRKQ